MDHADLTLGALSSGLSSTSDLTSLAKTLEALGCRPGKVAISIANGHISESTPGLIQSTVECLESLSVQVLGLVPPKSTSSQTHEYELDKLGRPKIALWELCGDQSHPGCFVQRINVKARQHPDSALARPLVAS